MKREREFDDQAIDARDDLYSARAHLPKALELQKKFPLFDGHNDLPWAMREGFKNKVSAVDLKEEQKGKFVDVRHKCLHTDIPRLREGGVGAQFWSVYIPTSTKGEDAVQMTLEQIDVVHKLCEKYKDDFEMADTADDVMRIFGQGKIAGMCGIEGGHQINGSLAALRMFYKLGARYMTLTHNGGPGWADPACEADGSFAEAKLGGLTPFGFEVVAEMNRIGMLVDLSHVHPVTMRAALSETGTKAPVIFSHSSSRALCDHARDVPDDVLKLLKINGGVCLVTFVSVFVAGHFWWRGGKVGATIHEVADHIDHIRKVAGIDHVGIGGDYDGTDKLTRGLEDVSCYPHLTAELLSRGYSDEEIGKVLGMNVIRVLRDCEQVALKIRSGEGPASLASEAIF